MVRGEEATMGTEWVNQYIEAWSTRDSARIVEWMANDCVYEDVTLGETHTGRDQIATFIDRMTTEFSDDFTFDLAGAASTDSHYWAEWVLTGTHNGSAGAVPPTGKTFAIRGVSVGTREGGKIKANRDYWDMASFLVQVGLAPPPPG
ncbi:MAG TPA: ester cyclase [Acidimicrobiales bacterium]|nr:ester cyclase [Acidimicrobiales bacterium]